MTPQEYMNRAIAMSCFSMDLDEFLAKIREDYVHGRKTLADLENQVEWALKNADAADCDGKTVVFV